MLCCLINAYTVQTAGQEEPTAHLELSSSWTNPSPAPAGACAPAGAGNKIMILRFGTRKHGDQCTTQLEGWNTCVSLLI